MLTRSTAFMGRTGIAEADEALQMDQDSFRDLYEATARGVWVFLFRRTGDEHLTDDLLQETYYRFLRTRRDYEGPSHQRNYLYRIAANAANDALRRQRRSDTPLPGESEPGAVAVPDGAVQSQERTDLNRAMRALKPRERDALWLAYAEGASHVEIAEALGIKKSSIKSLLFRARRRLADRLREGKTGRKP
jgi:RNA polymerase sigma-70 factor (ECF subfamily)